MGRSVDPETPVGWIKTPGRIFAIKPSIFSAENTSAALLTGISNPNFDLDRYSMLSLCETLDTGLGYNVSHHPAWRILKVDS